ncbi:hypothetical protein GGR43_002172 [Sphingobium jiangsuense]|uniref:Uncharacterized protein n=1 Tax=Sphingobium jiangsuense TaxID=870476 RepID=A0A7W6BMB7_9SPHN|nr:hypothetical protein [Sphingobium jiangsuense]
MHSPRDGVDEGGRLRPPFFVFGCRWRFGSGRWPNVPFRCLLRRSLLLLFLRLCQDFLTRGGGTRAKMESSGGRHFFPSFRPATSPSFGHISLSGGDRRGRKMGEADRNGKRIGRCFHRPLSVASTSLMSTLFPTEATGRNSDDRNGLMPASVAFLLSSIAISCSLVEGSGTRRRRAGQRKKEAATCRASSPAAAGAGPLVSSRLSWGFTLFSLDFRAAALKQPDRF